MACVAQSQVLATNPSIPQIRAASRQLAREWGFLRPTLAGTTLSPAATHYLIEISEKNFDSPVALRHVLALDDAALSRAAKELVDAGLITPLPPAGHGAVRRHQVTTKGREILASINDMAVDQVQVALASAEAVDPAAATTIMSGLQLYASTLNALRTRREAAAVVAAAHSTGGYSLPGLLATTTTAKTATTATTNAAAKVTAPVTINIHAGYRPGLLARAMDMNTAYFSAHHGWGVEFEAGLSTGLADLLTRLGRPMNQAWAATDARTQRIVGTIFIDGEYLGLPGVARLRSFVVDDAVRGTGAGRMLLAAAMEFVDEMRFDEVRLDTLTDLRAARRLYKTFDFVEVGEVEKEEFGMTIKALQCVWKRPEPKA